MSSPNRNRAEIIMQVHAPHTLSARPEHEPFTPDTVRQWLALCAELGMTTVFWTVNYAGKATYHSDVLPRMMPLEEGYFEKRGVPPGSAREMFNRMSVALDRFDTLDVALAACGQHGIALYADLGLFDMHFPGLENDFFEVHPELWLRGRVRRRPTQMYGQIMPEPYQRLAVDRDPHVPGQTWFRGLPCYAEPAGQDYWLSVIRELMRRGVDGFAFNPASHVQCGFGNTWRVIDGDEGADSFGFNERVVTQYQKRYGVNILTEQFEPARLHELHGEFFTTFLGRIREAIGPNRRLIAGTTMEGQLGYGVDGTQFRMGLDWQRWIEEGIVDDLMVYDHGSQQCSVELVQRQIKSKLSKGRVFIWREITDPESFDEYRQHLDQICAGTLDGYGLKELWRIIRARNAGTMSAPISQKT